METNRGFDKSNLEKMSKSDSKEFIRQLDKSLTNLLCSGQLITSVSSVVKELVENSLDAGATNIHISLLSFGFERITVRDNGCGIQVSDAPYMGRPHCTSKLVDYNDLNKLTTYGFRGEGLASVCTVADVTVETIRNDETVGRSYTLDNTGNIINEKPCAANKGTVVVVQNLFKNLPVRKQFFSTNTKKEEELRSIKGLLRALAIINVETRFVLVHNRTPIWTKQSCSNISKSLEEVFGFKVMQQLVLCHNRHEGNDDYEKFKIMAFLPKKDCDHRLIGKQLPDWTYVFVNRRPVKLKDVLKLLKAVYISANNLTGSYARYPVCCLMFDVAASSMDVNVDPNKQTVFFHQREELLRELTLFLEEHYGIKEAIQFQELDSSFDDSFASTPKAAKTVARINKSSPSSSYYGSNTSAFSFENESLSSSRVSIDNRNASTSNISLNSSFDKGDIESTVDSIFQQTDEEPVCIHVPFKLRQTNEIKTEIRPPPAKRQKTLDDKVVINTQVDNVTTVRDSINSNNGMSCTKQLRDCASRVLSKCKQKLEDKQLPLDFWVSSKSATQSHVHKEKKVVSFCIDTLRETTSNRRLRAGSQRNNGKCLLIGRFNDFWICKMNNELYIINHHRIHETVLLHSLMQTYKVATRPLGTPMIITEDSLGMFEFNTLTSLSYAYTPQDSIVAIIDERILANGFNIRKIEPSSQSNSTFQLVGLADHLPFFGIGDLKEVLQKITVDSSVSLYDSRTSVITQYLKTETVRMVRNCPYRLDKQEMVDLIQSMRKCKLEENCNQCFHGKPFFNKICDISIKNK